MLAWRRLYANASPSTAPPPTPPFHLTTTTPHNGTRPIHPRPHPLFFSPASLTPSPLSAQTAPTPSPNTLVLLLKHGKTVTFVYALPTTTLVAVKKQLHALLQENARHLSCPLPDSPSDIVLGAPRDPADLSKGFLPLSDDIPRGKRKLTCEEAGLENAMSLAWREAEDDEFDVQIPRDTDAESSQG